MRTLSLGEAYEACCRAGHRLKSDKTKTSKALQSLSCMRRVILSGTPIQNNLGEFYAMLGE
jgi:SNF2 family DNA or RNA helicase